ncbi:hypothetical protein K7432_007605 [Basidiobolus ranarum]|uniref:C2H2-type domain-containing protein n=1 Tax=Basidiobolus ranarum TaxID=34480 RepID=A0ABR2WT59_9FUNG
MLFSSLRRLQKRLSIKAHKVECTFCHCSHASHDCEEALLEFEQYIHHSSSHVLENQCVESSMDLEFQVDMARMRASIDRLSNRRLSEQDFTPYAKY